MIYDAFISYSHAADSKLASALQSALHRFAKPWYRLRALRVFRDQTSLSASPALWPAIQTALGEARYFVLLASPDAAGSVWVRRELEYWLGKRSTDTLLIVLTDGELAWDEDTADFNWAVTTVLPESMRRKFRQEPLYLDLRWARTQDHLTLANPRFAEAIADIAAPLRGQAKDDLIGEDIRQHKRTRRVTGGAIFVLVALTVVAVWQAYDATKQRNISEQRTRMVTSQLVADRADNLIAKHPVRAAVLAAEAVNITRRSEKAESHAFAAEATLRRALASMAGRGLGWYEHGVRGVSLSPDGRWLAALDGTERALVWDLSRSEPSLNVISLPGDGKEIKDVLVGPDSNLIATIGSGGARVWDLRKAQLNLRPRHFSSDAMELRKLLFSPNGRWLVGWDYNERIVVWDVAAAVDTGYPEGQRGRELRGHGRFGVDVEFSGDSRWLVTTSDNLARLWDLTQTDSTAIELALPAEDTFYPKLCATSRWLASRKDAGGIRMWDLTADAPAAGHIDLVGDDNKVEELLFAPDCKTMVSLSAGRVLIWNLEKFSVDAESNVAPISIGEQDAPLVHIAISPDGRILAGLTDDDGARTWRLDDESLSVRSFDTTLRDLQFVWFSDNGSWLMAASRDDGIAAWQVEGYKRVEAGGRWPKLSPDGRWLTSISRDHTIWVLDLNERDPLRHARILKGHEDAVNNVSLTADSKWLVSTSSDWTLRLWRLDGRDDPASPRSLRRDAFVKAISPDGSWLLTEEASRRLGLTRLDSGDTAPIELSGVGGSNSAIFSPDSRWLVAGGRPNALLWDLAALGRDSTPIHLEGHASPVIAMGFSPDGRWLATGTRNYSYSLPVNPTVRVWDMESDDVAGSAIHLGELRRTVRSFEFSSDGRWLVARGERRMAHVWDLAAQRHDADPFELPQEDDIRSVAVSPDSRWLVARDDDKSALLWNLGRPEEEPLVLPSFEAPPEADTGSGPRYMTVLVGHEAIVQTVAFSPDSRWLVTRGHQSFASLWDVASEDPISSRIVLTGHTGQVTSVAFSPDGRWLVTGSSDRTAAVWDMEARNPNANPIFLRAHTAPVFDVSISPDSRWLLTRSDDDTGRVWDLTAADPTKSGFVIGGRDGGVELALFDPNSAWLLVGGKLAREWQIWPLAIDALIGAARRAAGRNLTINEWALHRSDTDYRETFPDLPWPAGPGSGESGR
jgi:WD40 repeat protein